MTTPRIVVAGAGIAGLTAALALKRHGLSATVLERAARLDEAGAGLQLSANATRILRDLGLFDALLSRAAQPEAVSMRRARDFHEIGRVPLGTAGTRRWGAPYLTLARADLQDVLLEAARKTDIAVRFDAEVTRVTPGADEAAVTLAGGETLRAALAIGADGVWSRLRAGVPGAAPARFSGHVAWRARLDAGSAAGRALAAIARGDEVTTFVHPRLHLVAYGLGAGRGFNLVAITRGEKSGEGWSGTGDPLALAALMGRAAPRLRDIAAAAAPWRVWPIHEADPKGAWSAGGRLVLIGDAAHAMSPHAAQGAASAIEDAAVLAGMIARHVPAVSTPLWPAGHLPRKGGDQPPNRVSPTGNAADFGAAIAAFEALRRPRIARIVRRGALNRFAWQAAGPVALARDMVLKLRGPDGLAADLDWLYGHDADASTR